MKEEYFKDFKEKFNNFIKENEKEFDEYFELLDFFSMTIEHCAEQLGYIDCEHYYLGKYIKEFIESFEKGVEKRQEEVSSNFL